MDVLDLLKPLDFSSSCPQCQSEFFYRCGPPGDPHILCLKCGTVARKTSQPYNLAICPFCFHMGLFSMGRSDTPQERRLSGVGCQVCGQFTILAIKKKDLVLESGGPFGVAAFTMDGKPTIQLFQEPSKNVETRRKVYNLMLQKHKCGRGSYMTVVQENKIIVGSGKIPSFLTTPFVDENLSIHRTQGGIILDENPIFPWNYFGPAAAAKMKGETDHGQVDPEQG